MGSFFASSATDDAEYEASAGWYIAPEEERVLPRITAWGRLQQWIHHHARVFKYIVFPMLMVSLVATEMRGSYLQSFVLAHWAGAMTYQLEDGSSSRTRYPEHGPYNKRLGYSNLSQMIERLTARRYEITQQSRVSIPMALTMDAGLYPVYRHKDQAGLLLQDQKNRTLFESHYPGHAYTDPDSIPDMVWRSLLLIENRELMDQSQPYKNPAVEWDRFALAALERIVSGGKGPGGSTLATQLTKVRHSPGGRTDSAPEKLRQMASASLMAYRGGMETLAERMHIVKEYLNQLPLAATANHGEVNGLGDGLWAWYGSDFHKINDALKRPHPDSVVTQAQVQQQAWAYRQVLSLILSTRSPSTYLVRDGGPEALSELTDHYLPLMADAGIISDRLCREALKTEVYVLSRAPDRPVTSYITKKAANSVRMELLRKLGLTNLPALNRLDLTVHTTFDRDVQQEVADVLASLEDPAYLKAHDLHPLIGKEADPSDIRYSVVLFERAPHANVLRIQADNVEGPFDVNQGSMLELGSTAKVRVLVTYLELVERVFEAHGRKSADELDRLMTMGGDSITQWTVGFLKAHPAASRFEVLSAAVEREISGDPSERFYTGGGLHIFQNYNEKSDRPMTIRAAARESANLVFVRLLQEVVDYHIARLPGQVLSMLENPSDQRRYEYLERFALHEGRLFLRRYLRAYQERAPRGNVLDVLGERHVISARRLAWAYRAVFPQGSREAFGQYLQAYARDATTLTPDRIETLYAASNPAEISWQDRGYLAGIHPLELWMVGYLHTYPAATYGNILSASTEVRKAVYEWLFENSKRTQDPRIRTILEQEAFNEIHKMWSRLGYPFGRLVPTLATALGSSADRPAALAELMGILLRDGQRFPTVRVDSLHFGADTPYETKLEHTVPKSRQVLSPILCRVVRSVLRDVVEHGTAIRARGAIVDGAGVVLPIGGKTGTGDNRVYSTGPNGTRTSVAMSRTSTFVFYAGDRFFGTVVAYVEGPQADHHQFTSSLTTAILKMIGPRLAPLMRDASAARTLSTPAHIGG